MQKESDSLIKCSYSDILPLSEIQLNPKNMNSHSEEQIERLAKIINLQGQRHPIVISTLTGFVAAGEGRYLAMKKLGWSEVAVDFQEFDNEDQEYAFVVSDNSISEWSTLDLKLINSELENIELPDIELLGLLKFDIDPPITEKEKKEKICPNCGEKL